MPTPWNATFDRHASTFQPRYHPNIRAPVIRAIKMGLFKTLYTGVQVKLNPKNVLSVFRRGNRNNSGLTTQ